MDIREIRSTAITSNHGTRTTSSAVVAPEVSTDFFFLFNLELTMFMETK